MATCSDVKHANTGEYSRIDDEIGSIPQIRAHPAFDNPIFGVEDFLTREKTSHPTAVRTIVRSEFVDALGLVFLGSRTETTPHRFDERAKPYPNRAYAETAGVRK